MNSIRQSSWVAADTDNVLNAPEFICSFDAKKMVSAELEITALGVYEACLNGERVGRYVFAPGWTNDKQWLQVQRYDVTPLLQDKNELVVGLGRGWRMHALGLAAEGFKDTDIALIAALVWKDAEGRTTILRGDDFACRESGTVYNDMYNGEAFDATHDCRPLGIRKIDLPKDILVPQFGPETVEHERMPVRELIRTPAGETVLDFGQNISGYIEFTARAERGVELVLTCFETLDQNGNVSTRSSGGAKCQYRFIGDGATRRFKPRYTFCGFRYAKLENFPSARPEDFTAIVVHSEMERTGHFECSDARVNRLFENTVWVQRDNSVEVPTDCPQRGERFGWTGDTNAFCRTAVYHFDTERFFRKWLRDIASEQRADGSLTSICPHRGWIGAIHDSSRVKGKKPSPFWCDASVAIAYECYLAYGCKDLLASQFDSMRRWVDYLIAESKDGIREYDELWIGDWLSPDPRNPDGALYAVSHPNKNDLYSGKTCCTLIASACYANSLEILVKAARILDKDISAYRERLEAVKAAFIKRFVNDNGELADNTQTGCALALGYGLCGEHRRTVAAQLARLVREKGHITCGIVGTAFVLIALSDNGYVKEAYDLLLNDTHPSWLYMVKMGATTIWERWCGIEPDGAPCRTGFGSLNHPALGSVGAWLYRGVAGINHDEAEPGFKHILFEPLADARLSWARASLKTRHGIVTSAWRIENGQAVYSFQKPRGCTARIKLGDERIDMTNDRQEIERKQ